MRIVEVATDSKKYKVYIKRDIVKECGSLVKKVYKGKRIAVVTDSNVNKLYGEKLTAYLEKGGYEAFIVEVEAGEKSKCLNTLKEVCSVLLEKGITRSDLLITFGGGVVGDLGGFTASVLLRGIRYVQIPTSLLAQVDSGIGGKVGINLNEGKNLMGGFYKPEAVIADPHLLMTLEEKYIADGMGEIIKYACIEGGELYDMLMYNGQGLLSGEFEDIIEKCCRIKAKLIKNDERDNGERMLLNFGHTFGHAIEKYYDYSTYTHGEAVALGMAHITNKSENLGFTQRGTWDKVVSLLKKNNLPWKLPDMNKSKIKELILKDKKARNNKINIILLKNIGEAYIHTIEKDDIDKWL